MKIMAVLIYVSAGHYYYYFTFIVLKNMARCFCCFGIIVLFMVAVAMMIYCVWQYTGNLTPSLNSTVGYGATTLSGCYSPIWVNTIKVSTSTQTSLNLFKIPKASLKHKKISIVIVESNATFGNATQHRYFFTEHPLYSLEGGYLDYCVSAWTTQPVPLSSCLAQLHLFNDIRYCHQFIRDNAISKAIQKSSCLISEEHCIHFSFPSKSFYCVGLEIDPGVTMVYVQAHPSSGQLIQIDITGLQPNCALGGSVDTCDILSLLHQTKRYV